MALFKKLNKLLTEGLFASPTPITISNPAASQADITPITDIFSRTKSPTGIINTSEISFSASGRTITVSSTTNVLKAYYYGLYFEITCPDSTITIPDVANRGNFLYVNSSGILAQTTTFDMSLLGQLPTLCYVYWNGTESFVSPILRSVYMDGGTWARFMSMDDVSWEYGADLTANDSSLSISEGGFWMGDINEITSPATTVFYYYRDGSNWTRTTAGTLIYYLDTNLKYDNAGVLTSAGADEYVAYWLFKSMDKDTPFIVVCGQRTDATLNDSRANNSFDNLNLGTYPISGLKPLYRVIAKNNATPYVESLDLRNFPTITNATYITDDIRKALTSSNLPSKTNPIATLNDISSYPADAFIASEVTELQAGLVSGDGHFATLGDAKLRYEKINVGTDATTQSTNNIPSGAVIYKMHINITSAYTAGSTMSVGKDGTLNYIIDTTDVDITEIQLETYSCELDWSSSEKVYVTISGTPIAGACTITIWYYV